MFTFTLAIPFWAAWTLASFCAYYLLWSNANSFVHAAIGGVVRIRDVHTVFLENIGMVLRLIRRQPTYGSKMSPEHVFGFEARQAFPQDVQMACWQVVAQVRRERWTYPASQRNCVNTLAAQLLGQAREYVAFIERGERLRATYEKQLQMGQVIA